jgi:hypothetical protein
VFKTSTPVEYVLVEVLKSENDENAEDLPNPVKM